MYSTRRRINGRGGSAWEDGDWLSAHCWFASWMHSSTSERQRLHGDEIEGLGALKGEIRYVGKTGMVGEWGCYLLSEVCDNCLFSLVGGLFCKAGNFREDDIAHDEWSYCFQANIFHVEFLSCNRKESNVSKIRSHDT